MIYKKFMHPTIELCRVCEATGKVWKYPEDDITQLTEPTVEVCKICKGSGRVVVSKKTEITVEPFI